MIKLDKEVCISVGSLGLINFSKGSYAYVGSAQNGIKQRVNRHLSNNKRLHWHIDYLLNDDNTSVTKVFYKESGKEEECQIAKSLLLTEKPVIKFGCSDCKCNSHLFKLNNPLKLGMKVL
ncbi:MAG: GIY-YIG nuclease family protein [Candidatus Nanoarchaeia archaeon]